MPLPTGLYRRVYAVSYTHLDVYKRQLLHFIRRRKKKIIYLSELAFLSFFLLKQKRCPWIALEKHT